MKKWFNLFVTYLLTFSLAGIVLIHLFFLRKGMHLHEDRIQILSKEALTDIDKKTQEDEIKRIMDNPEYKFAEKFKQIHEMAKVQKDSMHHLYIQFLKRKEFRRKRYLITVDWSDSLWSEAGKGIKKQLAKLQEKTLYLYMLNVLSLMPVQRRLDKQRLTELIIDELNKRSIDVPFEFGVLDNGVLTAVHSEKFLMNDPNRLYVSQPILHSAEGVDNYELVLSFPKNRIYSSSVFYMSVLDVILILILIGIYFYTIYQLVRHKYLARMKTDFINNITHEFKTPIATMNLIVDTLRNPMVLGNQEMAKKYLMKLKAENKRMLDQVEKILMVGRIEQNRMVWKDEDLHLNELVEEAIEQMSLIIEDHNGKIYFDPLAEEDIVYGDPMMLQRVFINLIDNAIKYSNNDPVIQIRTYNKNDKVVVEVKDNGVGMDKATVKHMFDKFFRKPTGNVHNVKGHGIGLTFVKQVVDHMKGQIFVESEEGEGTTFYLYFPLVNK